MYRLLTITFAFAVFFGLTQAAPIPKDGDKPQFCFPTTVGTEVVQRHFNNGSHWDSTCTVASVEEMGRAKIVTMNIRIPTIRFTVNGVEEPQQFHSSPIAKYLVSADQQLLLAKYDPINKSWTKLKNPWCLFKLSAKPGESWTCADEAMEFKATFTVVKRERVKVPAGTFDAVCVESKVDQPEGQEPRRGKTWYVPGIGQVKSMEKDEVFMELISFTPGKK